MRGDRKDDEAKVEALHKQLSLSLVFLLPKHRFVSTQPPPALELLHAREKEQRLQNATNEQIATKGRSKWTVVAIWIFSLLYLLSCLLALSVSVPGSRGSGLYSQVRLSLCSAVQHHSHPRLYLSTNPID